MPRWWKMLWSDQEDFNAFLIQIMFRIIEESWTHCVATRKSSWLPLARSSAMTLSISSFRDFHVSCISFLLYEKTARNYWIFNCYSTSHFIYTHTHLVLPRYVEISPCQNVLRFNFKIVQELQKRLTTKHKEFIYFMVVFFWFSAGHTFIKTESNNEYCK